MQEMRKEGGVRLRELQRGPGADLNQWNPESEPGSEDPVPLPQLSHWLVA